MTDLPELTREDAIAEMERLATELYHAEDLLAFIREQLDTTTGPIEPAQLRQWLNYAGCAHAEPHAGPSGESLARILRHARLSAIQQAFRDLGWKLEFDITEDQPMTQYFTTNASDRYHTSQDCPAFRRGVLGNEEQGIPARPIYILTEDGAETARQTPCQECLGPTERSTQ